MAFFLLRLTAGQEEYKNAARVFVHARNVINRYIRGFRLSQQRVVSGHFLAEYLNKTDSLICMYTEKFINGK